jgi:thermitase
MKKLQSLLILVIPVILITLSTAHAAEFKAGEVLVKYKDVTTTAHVNRSLDAIRGVKVEDLISANKLVRVQLLSNQSVESALAQLQNNPDVEFAQPNFIYHATTTVPNDPYFTQQWDLSNTAQVVPSPSPSTGPNDPDPTDNPGIAGKDMNLEAAWDYVTDCSAVVVAVVDTGVDYNHEDLAANMWNGPSPFLLHGVNFQDSTNDPMDNNGHGTHVAGTIGAVGNNGLGTSGVCWKVQLMAVKSLDATGSGLTSTIANGISWAATNGANVINLSLGTGTDDPTMDAAITSAQTAGAVVVAAAGNSSTSDDVTPFYPCSSSPTHPNLICVTALDQSYNLASFSNFGTTSVQVGAPGVNIVSTWPYAVDRMKDDFTTWTLGTGWGRSTNFEFSSTGDSLLSNPGNWNGTTSLYASGLSSDAYSTYNLTPTSGPWDILQLQFYEGYNLAVSHAFVKTYVNSAGGDPVTSGVLQNSSSGNTGLTANFNTYDLSSSCATATCSVGFQFTSDSTTPVAGDTGAFIIRFEIQKGLYGTSSYNVLEGTSMAAPHVSGLAAMLFAFQPSYTYADVIDSLKYGGDPTTSLTGFTSTGNAVNAMGSLEFIRAPQNVTITKQ